MRDKKRLKKKRISEMLLALASITLFFALIANTFAEETDLVKIGDLEKKNIDADSNEALKDYYGDLLGIAGENSRFNNLAVTENIAILNVTIDGRDRRILTKIASGVLLPKITDRLIAANLQANNLTVIDNLWNLGKTIFTVFTDYGNRNFYGVESSTPRYADEGFSRLFDGKANVSINPAMRDLISSYNVFLSPQGITQGIYVAEKANSYFVVRGINQKSNAGFSWMLSAEKKDAGEKLESEYGKELGIEIRAEIDYEESFSTIKINGLNAIQRLINASVNASNAAIIGNVSESNVSSNSTNSSEINESNESASSDDAGISLITGNVIDEFGLETDLGQILGDESTLTETADDSATIEILDGAAIIPENSTNFANETYSDYLEFTLDTTDENALVDQIASITGLKKSEAMKLITFAYNEPKGFADEAIDVQAKIDGIEKINGSVIIRLG